MVRGSLEYIPVILENMSETLKKMNFAKQLMSMIDVWLKPTKDVQYVQAMWKKNVEMMVNNLGNYVTNIVPHIEEKYYKMVEK
jgi:hypothetical protein